ncbi:MAG TPA: hypothetical protein VN048_04690 [Verrucomicrobiae bacterium]|nr:hypothetical protein [Verrucomicrobiae bacterium]
MSNRAAAQLNYSQAYTWTTLAGLASSGATDGIGNNAQFSDPWGMAVDAAGNLFVADSGNNTIREITPAGAVTTIAGFAGTSGAADGTNSSARFDFPVAITVDASTNLYVADQFNNTIRKVARVGNNWVVSTIAGLAGSPGEVDGTNNGSRFNSVQGIAVDTNGNLFIGDTTVSGGEPMGALRKIVRIGTNWVTTTVANGFPQINGVALDKTGQIYITEYTGFNGSVSKITVTGTNWAATNVGSVFRPVGIGVDSTGNVIVSDYGNYQIDKFSLIGTSWVGSLIAGQGYPVIGNADGTGAGAQFLFPAGVVLDSANNIYVADSGNNSVRLVTEAGNVSTIAGSTGSSGSVNGTGNAARFNNPWGLAVGTSGSVYVADLVNDDIRRITPDGVVATTAGTARAAGTNDGTGSNARFEYPDAVAADASGNVYLADNANFTIRKITPSGVVNTIAGLAATSGSADGLGTNARFSGPSAIAVDRSGIIYVADSNAKFFYVNANFGDYGISENYGTGNYTIRKLAPSGSNWMVSTIAGNAGHLGETNGTGTNALFGDPEGIAVDAATNLYVADSGNSTIRKLKLVGNAWTVSTIAGSGSRGSSDGTNTSSSFDLPNGITVDSASNLYVADANNHAIRKITPVGTNWVVSTIGGLAGARGSADGAGSGARFFYPYGIAVGSDFSLYVADTFNNTIRKGVFTGYGAANPVSLNQPANNASLVVNLVPSAANGQWRFPWELAWRPSGSAATNLVPNQNYAVEFSPVPGYVAAPALVTNFVTGGQTNFVTGQYYPTITSVDATTGGSLEIFFQVNPPSGAGWRLLGDTNAFLPSGYTTNLLAGNYLIECAALSNFVQIPILSVRVSAGLPTVVQEIYQPSQPAPGGFLLPTPVASGEISNTSYPYGFNGQLETDVGNGSGVAVEANVVLTAAHLVFDDQTLSYASQAWWYAQEEAPQSVPEPQAAQGWLVLSGYASQRTNDLESGLYLADESSPQSRNYDVAALFFPAPVAGGGYGGYLPSDATPNSWLTSTANKMLVGYPVDGSMFQVPSVVPGQMYEIGPQPYPLSVATDPVADQQVYVASWFLSYPGNSGGPLYVQFNGYYYPAGVYLGTLFSGTVPYASAVRAIDSSVVNLITNAQAVVTGGTNNSGGGVITIVPSVNTSVGNPGYLILQLGPPAAVQAGAAWKLASQSDSFYLNTSLSAQEITTTNELVLQFKPVPGWNLPTNQSVLVAPGAPSTNLALYTVTNPVLVLQQPMGLGLTGTTNTSYVIEYRTNLTTGAWLTLSTNTILSNGFNPVLPWPPTNGPTGFYRAVWLPQP